LDAPGFPGPDLADHCSIRIVKRNQRAFKIVGLNWIVERSFGWLGRHRRMSKDYEFRVQTSETLITIVACAQMLRRLAPK
jgi:putative transposase